MLDFYLINDSQPKPNHPSRDLAYVGGIEEDVFYQMQAEGIIETWFDYYGHFRWGSEIVVRMLQKLQVKQKSETLQKEKKAFADILQRAVDVKCGMLGLGD